MYIPEGFGTVFPYIFAIDANAYLTFLEHAFGAEVVGKTESPGGTVANARVRIGTTNFMVSEASERFKPSKAAFYIYVEDADHTHREALANGAEDIHAPMAMDYGDRQGGVTDPSGNIWWISTASCTSPTIERSMVRWAMAHSVRGGIVRLSLAGALLIHAGGCAERKTCFFQCHEPALNGFGDGCSIMLDTTEEECRTNRCDENREVRHAWGEVPKWCSDHPEKYQRYLER